MSNVKCDLDYYNDLPGKMPPEFGDSKLSNVSPNEKRRERLHSNLIDLNSPGIEHDYVNDDKKSIEEGAFCHVAGNINFNNNNVVPKETTSSSRDVFDLRKLLHQIDFTARFLIQQHFRLLLAVGGCATLAAAHRELVSRTNHASHLRGPT